MSYCGSCQAIRKTKEEIVDKRGDGRQRMAEPVDNKGGSRYDVAIDPP